MIKQKLICQQCSKYFTRTQNRGKKIYCSIKCSSRAGYLKRDKNYWKKYKLDMTKMEKCPENRIKMPKAPLPADTYDWEMIAGLPKGEDYG